MQGYGSGRGDVGSCYPGRGGVESSSSQVLWVGF